MSFFRQKTPIYLYIVAFLLTLSYPVTVIYSKKYKAPQQDKQAQVLSSDVINTSQTQSVQYNQTTPTLMVTLQPSPTKKPAGKKIQFGVVVNDYANKNGGLSYFDDQGIGYSTVSIYKQFGHPTNKNLIADDLSYMKSKGKRLLITWEPSNPLEQTQSRDYLKEIPGGVLDGYIRDFAHQVSSYGNKVILRFGHEMNGDWYPWSGRPEEYIKAYRHVVDVFRAEGVNNTTYMWSINSNNVPVSPIASVSKFYPGDAYVDVIGIDGFNFGSVNTWSKWSTFKEIYSEAYNFLSKTYNKPIIISEIASAEIGGNKADWVEDMFADLNSGFAKIEGIIWFNLLKETDWRVNSSDSVLAVFKEKL